MKPIEPLDRFAEYPSDLDNKTNEDILYEIHYLTEKVNEIIEVINELTKTKWKRYFVILDFTIWFFTEIDVMAILFIVKDVGNLRIKTVKTKI